MAHPIPIQPMITLAIGGVIICGAISAMAHNAYVEIDKRKNFSGFVDRMSAMTGVLLLSILSAIAGWYAAPDFPSLGHRLASMSCGIGGLMAPALYGGVVAGVRRVLDRKSGKTD